MIKPALSNEEWERMGIKCNLVPIGLDGKHGVYALDGWPVAVQDQHSLAAMALHGQAYGFDPVKDENGYTTPDYAWAIRECADALDRLLRTTPFGMQDDRSIASFAIGFARSAADRIEALIPKRDK